MLLTKFPCRISLDPGKLVQCLVGKYDWMAVILECSLKQLGSILVGKQTLESDRPEPGPVSPLTGCLTLASDLSGFQFSLQTGMYNSIYLPGLL